MSDKIIEDFWGSFTIATVIIAIIFASVLSGFISASIVGSIIANKTNLTKLQETHEYPLERDRVFRGS